MYERTRFKRMHAQEEYSQRNWGSPYPKSLQNLPKSTSASWIREKIASAKANGKPISLEEQEYAFRPDWHVSTLLGM